MPLRMITIDLLMLAGISSGGMMAAGGLMAETSPVPDLGGNAGVLVLCGVVTGIFSGLGALLKIWSEWDLKRRESNRLDKGLQAKLDEITLFATTTKLKLDEVQKQLDLSTDHWHEEREKLNLQLVKAYEVVNKVSGQLTSIQIRADANTAMIDATRKDIDLPPLPANTMEQAQ